MTASAPHLEEARFGGRALLASRSLLAPGRGKVEPHMSAATFASGTDAQAAVFEKKPEPEGQPTDFDHLQTGDIVKVFRTTTITRRHVWAKIKILKSPHEGDKGPQISIQVIDYPFLNMFGLGYLFVWKKNQLYIQKSRSDSYHYHYELLERKGSGNGKS